MHWYVRQPPESVRDGVETRRHVPSSPPRIIRCCSSGGCRREHRHRALEGAFVQGRQDPSRRRTRVGRDLAVWAILVRRFRALGSVARCAVVFRPVSSRARTRSSATPARPRVAPTAVARAPLRLPSRSGSRRRIAPPVHGLGTGTASDNKDVPITRRRAAPKRSGPAATNPHSTNGDTTRTAHINGHSRQPRQRLTAGV